MSKERGSAITYQGNPDRPGFGTNRAPLLTVLTGPEPLAVYIIVTKLAGRLTGWTDWLDWLDWLAVPPWHHGYEHANQTWPKQAWSHRGDAVQSKRWVVCNLSNLQPFFSIFVFFLARALSLPSPKVPFFLRPTGSARPVSVFCFLAFLRVSKCCHYSQWGQSH